MISTKRRWAIATKLAGNKLVSRVDIGVRCAALLPIPRLDPGEEFTAERAIAKL